MEFSDLGDRIALWLRGERAWPGLDAAVEAGAEDNPFFTPYMQRRALEAVAEGFLRKDRLRGWLARYPEPGAAMSGGLCGVVASGNIPAVAFHDILCVRAAGWKPLVKLSSKDRFLLPVLFPDVEFCRSVKGWSVDALLTMGGDSAAEFFSTCFADVPKLVRAGRFSLAVLNGREGRDELGALAEDMLLYYGLGCRSVTCLLVPEDYDFAALSEALEEFAVSRLGRLAVDLHRRNRAVLTLAGEGFYDGGTIILRDLKALCGSLEKCRPYGMELNVGEVWYVRYSSQSEADEFICRNSDRIQKIIRNFGSAQRPAADDYPDGVDTVAFLRDIKI